MYLDDLRFHFEYLTKKLVAKGGLSFMVHSALENKVQVQTDLHKFFEGLKRTFKDFNGPMPFLPDEEEFVFDGTKEFHVVPNFTNYCARAFRAPHYHHPDTPKLQMAGELTRSADPGRVPAPTHPRKGRRVRVGL